MTSSDLLDENKVCIPVEEYQELIQSRKEVERLRRENYGLKTTVRNLKEKLEKQYVNNAYTN
jgi:hypothetical protein